MIELDCEEFQRLFPIKQTIKQTKRKNRKPLAQKQIDTIKHIFEINPKRSPRSVGRELGIHRSTVQYWWDKFGKT